MRDAALMPPVRLGVRGLPHLTSNMVSGGLYVLVAETPSSRYPLLASSLSCALKDGRPCGVILAGNPEHFVQRLESLGGVPATEHLLNKQLQLFVTQTEFSKKMFRFGAEGFVQELEHFQILPNSYLVFDQADDLIALHDITLAQEQFEVLGQWLMKHQVTGLLVFVRATEADAAVLNALMDSMTGIVRLGGDEEGLRLGFDYWQSPEGTVAARLFQLTSLSSGQYEASVRVAGAAAGAAALQEAADAPPVEAAERHYFYMDPDLGSLSTQMAGVWLHVDTLVGLMHATRNKQAATVIFCFGPGMSLRQLAEAVHTLRIHLGRYAQLVVQEKNASLRYENEALLLRLGVNMVIHRDVAPSRLPLLLDSVAGQVFSREVDVDFEAALASVMPIQARGYQAPTRFVREVKSLLERSNTLNIPFALGIGKPMQDMGMVDVLNSMRIARAGDLATADHESCYLFLNACQQSVILATVERILAAPLDTVFEGMRFLVSRDEIGNELAALLRHAETGLASDYTSVLVPVTAPVPVVVDRLAAPSDVPVVAAVPVAALARPATAERFEARMPISPLPRAVASSADAKSLYGATNASVYGKTEAPRAKRSTSNTP
jgi:cellulose biosynthesis protein BcsE